MRLKSYRHLFQFCIICSMSSVAVYGQSSVKIADGFYEKGDYSSAAKYYERAATGNGEAFPVLSPYQLQKASKESSVAIGSEVFYRLAESHRLLNRHSESEKWYAKVLASNAAPFPLTRLYYGESLLANGKYQDSETALKAFLKEYKKKDLYRARAERTLASLSFIKGLKLDESILVKQLPLGDTGANYAATWAGANSLLFTSTRIKDASNVHRNALYTGGGEQAAAKLPLEVSQPDFGTGAFSPDGKRLYFMSTGIVDGPSNKKRSLIYMSEQNEGAWATPVALGNNVNYGGSNARQPFISSDGKWLLYSSDRPGGKGGLDIWYAPLDEKGQPGKPVNAGPAINTRGNEEAPFYHTASATLVFASDELPGMGGYDLFAATGAVGNWATPVNMGMPVNSVKDDIYFASRGADLLDDAMISSDRASDCCLQTLALGKPMPVVSTLKTDTSTAVVINTTTPLLPAEAGLFDSSNTFVTRGILFDFDKAVIKPSSYEVLDKLVAYLVSHPDAKIELGAHTDGKGNNNYNQVLSEKRAKACVDYIVSKDIAADRLISKGNGECCPLEKETDASGHDLPASREQNRRVEVKLKLN